MPIHGLTDRNEGNFPQIGVIRKGAPKGQNAPGKDLAWFRVELDAKEVKAQADFETAFGKQPTEIVIVLPFNEIGRCWEAWRETYVAGALIHRCDGQYVQYAIDPKTGERLVVNGIGQNGQPVLCKGKADGCRPTGRLHVIVPALKRLAYMVVMTTSINDIIHISEQLAALCELNIGRIAGIPLVLRRTPKKISTPSGEGGKRARREKWLISIEADPEWVKKCIAHLHAIALPGNGLEALQIAAPQQVAPAPGPEWTDKIGDDDNGDDDDNVQEGEVVSEVATEAVTTEPTQPTQPAQPIKAKPKFWTPQAIKAIVDGKLAQHSKNAGAMLDLSNYITPQDPDDILLKWATKYRELRNGNAESADAALGADNFLRSQIAPNEAEPPF